MEAIVQEEESSSPRSSTSSSRSHRRRDDGLSAMGMLYLTIIANCLFHLEPRILNDLLAFFDDSPLRWWSTISQYSIFWHSKNYTTVSSTIGSLFTHADWGHLVSNMFLLWVTGRSLFILEHINDCNPRRGQQGKHWSQISWTSPLAFVWFYLGSQLLSVVGCRMICYWLDHQRSYILVQQREEWSWQWVPYSWRDALFTLSRAEKIVDLRVWQYTPSIGSSAAVYGIVGAHVYAAVCCRRHPATMSLQAKAIWLGKIGTELANTPLSLEQLSMRERGDNIDHAAHLCGFLGGFLLAFVWDRIVVGKRRQHTNYENIMHDL